MKLTKLKQVTAGFFLLFLLPTTTHAIDLPIKVACILDQGFFLMEGNGEISGYSHDYLQLLSQYTGWTYEYVIIDEGNTNDSLGKAVDMLANGEVDLMTTAYRLAGSENYFAFPDSHTGVSRYCLTSLATNHDITIDNYFLKEELTVALVEGMEINDIFMSLFDLRDLKYKITYVNSYADALALLENGYIETMLMTDTSFDSGKVSYLTTIDRTPFYFVADKSNTLLAEEINQAMITLNAVAPNTHQSLLVEYFGVLHTQDTMFSQESKDSLAEYDYLTVGLIKNLPPYQLYDDETEEYCGITIEILEVISDMIEKEFRYVWVDTHEELEEKAMNGELDICGTIPLDYELALELGMILSEPYVTSGTTVLTRANVQTETAVYHFVSDNIPYYERENLSIEYDIKTAMINLSEHGTSNIFCDSNVAKYYQNKLKLENIDSITVSNISSEIALGMGKHLDVKIMGMLNNALLQLDSNLVAEIVLHNLTISEEATLESLMEQFSTELTILAFLVLSLFLFFTIYNSKKFKKLSRQDSMTKLNNSGYFHEYVEGKLSKLSSGVLILVDIDFFKDVNDTHGHSMGDKIIQQVAKHMVGLGQSNGFYARVGGDEFALLIEGAIDKEKLEKEATAFLKAMVENETGIPATLSIGGFIFDSPMEYETLYKNADKVLYVVKENGRNGFLMTTCVEEISLAKESNLLNPEMFKQKVTQAISPEKTNKNHALLLIHLHKIDSNKDYFNSDFFDEVAGRIKHQVRQHDFLCTQDESSFLLFLTSCGTSQNISDCKLRIVQTLSEPFSSDSKEFSVKTNVVVAMYPDDGGSYPELMENLNGNTQ